MKRKGMKWVAVWCAAVGVMAALTACSSSGSSMNGTLDKAEMAVMSSNGSDVGVYSYVEEALVDNAMAPAAQAETEGGSIGEAGAASQAVSERKLIKTVDMSVETKEFDKMLDQLDRQIEAAGGYVQNRNTYNGSIYSGYRSSRSADMNIRIPQAKLDDFLDTVSGISNVISRNDRVDDITLSYVDLKSHKGALETEQARLLELLEQAQSVEDIITIEERLSKVRYQIESMESQLRTYDNQVDYSTVTLNIQEVQELTPAAEENVWERISSGFVNSLRSIGSGLEEIGIWFLINLPYLVILAAVIVVLVLIFRRQMKRTGAGKS